ncbi:uncharacterized protein LOC128955086 [Oppia nitens]|uniref:uncharacterized protein LOC128955086 n=1 Tax=Oppia nitens TaxID=1686743 RepID=UPI0023DBC3FE|nr:uncharacterized protein LOC128955086 [Oppia nitens]
MSEDKQLTDGLHEFQRMFNPIIDKVLDNSLESDYNVLRSTLNKMFNYNVGDLEVDGFARILIVAYSVMTGHKPGDHKFDDRVYPMSWAIELTKFYFDILDDVMDGSDTRRGQPCWHTLPTVGMSALNDSTIVLSAIYKIIKLYFSDHQNYVEIVHCVQEFIEKTAYGQMLDMQFSRSLNSNVDLNLYNYTNYRLITKSKYASISTGSFLLAMYISGQSSYDHLDKIDDILTTLSVLQGVTNDLEDFQTDGTDIVEGKCSWLYVRALQLANNSQKSLLLANYGLKDPSAVQLIKQLYDELDIKNESKEFVKRELIVMKQKYLDNSTDDTIFYQLINKFSHMIANNRTGIKSNDCYICSSPCSAYYCCSGSYPQCCLVGGQCRCCSR